jgi:hypothetical protein
MQGGEEEEGTNSMQVTQNHSADGHNEDDDAPVEGTPSISKLNAEDSKGTKQKSSTTTATHILCNGGLDPQEVNGQSGGEGQQVSNGPKAGEGQDTDSKVSSAVVVGEVGREAGDTPLPHPVTLTDAALPPQTPASQQGDSGFGSGFDLLRMDSQDDQTDIATSPDGERRFIIRVCFQSHPSSVFISISCFFSPVKAGIYCFCFVFYFYLFIYLFIYLFFILFDFIIIIIFF